MKCRYRGYRLEVLCRYATFAYSVEPDNVFLPIFARRTAGGFKSEEAALTAARSKIDTLLKTLA